MATTYTVVWHNSRNVVVQWNLGVNEAGDPFPTLADMARFGPALAYPDKTIQAWGTWGSGGTVTVEGSLESGASPANLVALEDVHNNALSLATATPIECIKQNTMFIRPKTSNTATLALTIRIAMTRRGG